jgi:hypothetical protein
VSRDGAVAVFLPHGTDPDLVMHFTVTGPQLTIGDSPVCAPAADRYRWHASSGRLTIVVVADGCRPRAALFGGTGTWLRSA